jgi:hypothetical protein
MSQSNTAYFRGRGVRSKHAASHAEGGSDPISPILIGAAPLSHTHAVEDVVGLQDAINEGGTATSALLVRLDAHEAATEDVHGSGVVITSENIATYAPAPDLSPFARKDGVTFTGAVLAYPDDPAVVPLAARATTGQTANLTEWRAANGTTVLARVTPAGSIHAAQGLKAGTPADPGNGEVFASSRIIASQGQPHQVQLIAVNGNAGVQFGSAGDANLVRDAAGSLTVEAAGSNPSRLRVKLTAGQGSDAIQVVDSNNTGVFGVTQNGDVSGRYFNASVNMTARRVFGIAQAVGDTPMVSRGFAGQTADLQQWQNSAGTVILAVTKDGGLAGDNGGFPTMSISGNVMSVKQVLAGVGGGVATDQVLMRVRAPGSNHTGNLQEWQNHSGSALAYVTAAGGFNLNGDIISASNISAAGYLGSQFGRFTSQAAGTVGVIVRGGASQTADLEQWQNSAGTVLAKVDASGNIDTSGHVVARGSFLESSPTAGVHSGVVAGTPRVLFADGTAAQNWQIDNSGGTFRWFTPGNVRMSLQADGRWGVPGHGANEQALITTQQANRIALTVKGAASQTASLQEWQDSAGVIKAAIGANGQLSFNPATDTATIGATGLQFGANRGQAHINLATGHNRLNSLTVYPYEANTALTVNATNPNGGAATTGVPTMVIKGAANQTADMLQAQWSDGTVRARIDTNGNIFATANNSTTTNPRTIGIDDFTSGEAGRFQFGDPLVSLQASHGGRLQLQSYWGVQIFGSRQNMTPQPFETGAASDPSLSVIGTVAAAPVLMAKGAASQTGNLFEARDSADATKLSVSAAGVLTFVDANLYRHSAGVLRTASSFVSDSTVVANYGQNPGQVQIGAVGPSSKPAVVFAFGDTSLYRDAADVLKTDDAFVAASVSAAGASMQADGRFVLGGGQAYATIDKHADSTYLLLRAGGNSAKFQMDANKVRLNLPFGVEAVGEVPLVARGMAGQTGNLQEWQNSAGGGLAHIDASGRAMVQSLLWTGPAEVIKFDNGGTIHRAINGANPTMRIRPGAGGGTSQDLTRWETDGGTALSYVNGSGQLVAPRAYIGPIADADLNNGLHVKAPNASAHAVVARMQATPTGDAFRALNDAGDPTTVITGLGNVDLHVPSGGVTRHIRFVTTGDPNDNFKIGVQQTNGTWRTRIAGGYANGLNLYTQSRSIDLYGMAGSEPAINGSGKADRGVHIVNTQAGNIGAVVTMAASQTADAFQVRDSADAVKFAVSPTGAITIGGDASITRPSTNALQTGADFFFASGALVANNSARLVWSGDTNLYRDSANVLKTDDTFESATTIRSRQASNGTPGFWNLAGSAANMAWAANASGDAEFRHAIYADGKMEWGAGAGARDTNLYRESADILRTDDTLKVGGNAYVFASLFLSNNGDTGLSRASAGVVAAPSIIATTTDAAKVSLVAQGVASQTANLIEARDSAAVARFKVAADGSVGIGRITDGSPTFSLESRVGNTSAMFVNNVAMNNYANFGYGNHATQPFSHRLTGAYNEPADPKPHVLAIHAARATETPLLVKGTTSQTADLLQAQDSAGTTKAGIDSGGGFYIGPSASTAIVRFRSDGVFYPLTAGASRFGGHDNRFASVWAFKGDFAPRTDGSVVALTVAGADGTQTANIAEFRAKTSDTNPVVSISPAGTVVANGDMTVKSSMAVGAGAPYWGDSRFIVQTDQTAQRGQIIKMVASATGNALEVRDSADAVKTSIAPDGSLFVGTAKAANFNWTMGVWGSGLTSYDPLVLRGNYRNTINAGSLPSFGTGATAPTVGVEAAATTSVPLVLRGAASQTADLLQVQDSAGAVKGGFGSDGRVYLGDPNWYLYKESGTNLRLQGPGTFDVNGGVTIVNDVVAQKNTTNGRVTMGYLGTAGRYGIGVGTGGPGDTQLIRAAAGVWEVPHAASGIILRASDDSRWKITVGTDGILETVAA